MTKKLKHQDSKLPAKCIFCGKGNMSKEHIFAEWIQDFVPISFEKMVIQTSFIDSLPLTKIRSGDPLSQRLRVVCANCNNGWMSQLQEKAKPILSKMITGNWWNFSWQEEKILSAWAVMYTMVVEFNHPRTRAVSQYDRRKFMQAQTPSRNWKIWCVPYGGKVHAKFWHKGFSVGQQPVILQEGGSYSFNRISCDAQVTTFNVGKVLFHSFYGSDRFNDLAPGMAPGLIYEEVLGLHCLWPQPWWNIFLQKQHSMPLIIDDDGAYEIATALQTKMDIYKRSVKSFDFNTLD